MRTLVVSPWNQGRRLAICQDGDLRHLFYETSEVQGLWGATYTGRVLRSYGSYALVDIGLHRPGLLPLKGQKFLDGQYITVQVTREAMEDLGESVFKGVHLVLRSDAAQAPVTCIYQPQWIDQAPRFDQAIFESWSLRANFPLPEGVSAEVEPLAFENRGLEDIWSGLMSAKVPLNDEAFIVIKQVLGFTVVDVNTGSQSPRDVNFLAIPAIIQQLRWRNLCGNILIDFVHPVGMRKEIVKTFQNHLTDDDGSYHILGWSDMGPLQVRRPIRTQPLWMKIMTRCANCLGEGYTL